MDSLTIAVNIEGVPGVGSVGYVLEKQREDLKGVFGRNIVERLGIKTLVLFAQTKANLERKHGEAPVDIGEKKRKWEENPELEIQNLINQLLEKHGLQVGLTVKEIGVDGMKMKLTKNLLAELGAYPGIRVADTLASYWEDADKPTSAKNEFAGDNEVSIKEQARVFWGDNKRERKNLLEQWGKEGINKEVMAAAVSVVDNAADMVKPESSLSLGELFLNDSIKDFWREILKDVPLDKQKGMVKSIAGAMKIIRENKKSNETRYKPGNVLFSLAEDLDRPTRKALEKLVELSRQDFSEPAKTGACGILLNAMELGNNKKDMIFLKIDGNWGDNRSRMGGEKDMVQPEEFFKPEGRRLFGEHFGSESVVAHLDEFLATGGEDFKPALKMWEKIANAADGKSGYEIAGTVAELVNDKKLWEKSVDEIKRILLQNLGQMGIRGSHVDHYVFTVLITLEAETKEKADKKLVKKAKKALLPGHDVSVVR